MDHKTAWHDGSMAGWTKAGHPDASIAAAVTSLVTHRQLIRQLIRREVLGRYRGSVFGIAWSLLTPLLMLVVYTFVFSRVFHARWSTTDPENTQQFAVILFVGLIVHGLVAECVNRAPSLILGNVNYVKKVVFPLEILAWVALGTALFHAFASCVALLLALLVLNGAIPWTALLLPVVLLPLLLITIGVTWFLAAIGVFVRDVAQAISLFMTVLMFLSPVFYPLSSLPAKYQFWLSLNPLTYSIEEARQVLIWGHGPSWSGWLVQLVVGILIAWAGFWWFQKTRKGFADVL